MKTQFDISEVTGGVHIHSQGEIYPIIPCYKGQNFEKHYLYAGYAVKANSVKYSTILDFAKVLKYCDKVNDISTKTEIAEWFKANGFKW